MKSKIQTNFHNSIYVLLRFYTKIVQFNSVSCYEFSCTKEGRNVTRKKCTNPSVACKGLSAISWKQVVIINIVNTLEIKSLQRKVKPRIAGIFRSTLTEGGHVSRLCLLINYTHYTVYYKILQLPRLGSLI